MAITDDIIGVSKLLGGTCPVFPQSLRLCITVNTDFEMYFNYSPISLQCSDSVERKSVSVFLKVNARVK